MNQTAMKKVRPEHEIMSTWNDSANKPIVSIVCNTYQHVLYIADALDGFLAQQTNFPFEIIVRDDASSDGAAEIVQNYAKKYPNIVKAVLEHDNQYSRGIKPSFVSLPLAQGLFIAFCEGDDYWLSHDKLQKQVDFLNENAGFAGCFHDTKLLKDNVFQVDFFRNHSKIQLNTEDTICETAPFHTSSFLFRASALMLPPWMGEVISGDMALFSIVSAQGYLGYIHNVYSVYRKHDGGVTKTASCTGKNYHKGRIYLIECLNEFHKYKFDKKAQMVIDFHKNQLHKIRYVNKLRNYLNWWK